MHQHGHQFRLSDVRNLVLDPPLVPLDTPRRDETPAEGRWGAAFSFEHPEVSPGQKKSNPTVAAVAVQPGALTRGKGQLVDNDLWPDVLGDVSVAAPEQGRLVEIWGRSPVCKKRRRCFGLLSKIF